VLYGAFAFDEVAIPPKVRIRGKTTLNKFNGRRPPPQRTRNRRALVSLGLAPKACRPVAVLLKEQYAVGKKAAPGNA